MAEQRLERFIGSWKGNCRTWFEPNKLADESEVEGQFEPLLEGRFVRHSYHGTIKGRSRRGDETIAFNSITKQFQVSWVDDFHMSDAIMFSTGDSTPGGFQVIGKYDVGAGAPAWSWRTEYEMIDEDRLTITAYNISPEGEEAKAVETEYVRKS